MANFNVNMKQVIGLTAKLERLNRTAFPVAVRQTLNDVAFETRRLVPIKAAEQFTIRQKNFLSVFFIVEKAKGYKVDGMVARAGINPAKGSKIADGLEKQELGGNIEGRKLIPHNMGRVSGSHSKKLRAPFRFSRINIATSKNKRPGAKYLLIKKGGKGTVFELKKLKSRRKFKPVFVYRKSNISKVKKSPFMAPSATLASKRMHEFFKDNAEYQFKRALK